MKKIAFITIIVATGLLSFLMQADWGVQKFTDILEVNPDNVTKLELSMPNDSSYRTTTDRQKYRYSFNTLTRKIIKKSGATSHRNCQ
ncbi:hypothetical protein [Lentibacillus sp.]|uniref:hypothetical protein n=1 Tax=Lentibacillus sp. TaxID=1925746 RepID=UPI002B4B757E|nr:hypothetical protein [Lentibacillus sp.]HLS07860.1 hypothetical protein [Lentibacillus sp.]